MRRSPSQPIGKSTQVPALRLLATPSISQCNGSMGRIFGFLSLIAAMAVGMYIYAHDAQNSSTAAGASNPKAAININGVRMDLLTIAQAERGYFALEGKYASLDELISSRSMSVARQRLPYTYSVETSSNGFHVIASREGGDDGSGTPSELSVDENMQVEIKQ